MLNPYAMIQELRVQNAELRAFLSEAIAYVELADKGDPRKLKKHEQDWLKAAHTLLAKV